VDARRPAYHYPLTHLTNPSLYLSLCPYLYLGDAASFIGAEDFPLSSTLHTLLSAASATRVDLLLASLGAVDQVFSNYKFRHALADEFSKNLRLNAGKRDTRSFELRASRSAAAACSNGQPGCTLQALLTP
jgi:hypothetical protein